jgi:hypothetical protein
MRVNTAEIESVIRDLKREAQALDATADGAHANDHLTQQRVHAAADRITRFAARLERAVMP